MEYLQCILKQQFCQVLQNLSQFLEPNAGLLFPKLATSIHVPPYLPYLLISTFHSTLCKLCNQNGIVK